MVERHWIPIKDIQVSPKQRKKVAWHKVRKHARAFEEGREVEPIDIVACTVHGQARYRILGNGRHRYFGAIEAQMPVIECRVHASRSNNREHKTLAIGREPTDASVLFILQRPP